MPHAAGPGESELADWLRAKVATAGVPGASLAVLRGGDVALAQAGALSTVTGEPVTADSVFQVGSTTKVMTAAIVLQLVDEGALSLETRIGDVLVEHECATNLASVTVRQLLDHTSGLPGNYFADFGPGSESIARYVDALAQIEPIHPAGAMFSYSNGGYVVAGRVAEVVAGVSFADLVRERIADRLDLKSTTTRLEDVQGMPVATGHEPDANGAHRVAEIQVAAWSSTPAGSQMMSTAENLARFGRAAIGRGSSDDTKTLVSSRSVELMTTPSVDLPCPYWGSRSQCLGWALDVRDGTTVLLHGGGTTGHSAMLLAVPEADVVIALLTNSAAGGRLLGEAERWLLENVVAVGPPLVAPSANHHLTVEEADALTGVYTDIWTTTTIERADRGLVAHREIHETSLNPAQQLPPVQLTAIGPRLLTAGAGRPILFLGDDPVDPTSPVKYLHQGTASRRIG